MYEQSINSVSSNVEYSACSISSHYSHSHIDTSKEADFIYGDLTLLDQECKCHERSIQHDHITQMDDIKLNTESNSVITKDHSCKISKYSHYQLPASPSLSPIPQNASYPQFEDMVATTPPPSCLTESKEDQSPPKCAFDVTIFDNENNWVTVDASKSMDMNGDPCTAYLIDFGDGSSTIVFSPLIHHRYSKPGSYNVSLTVMDRYNRVSSQNSAISIGLMSKNKRRQQKRYNSPISISYDPPSSSRAKKNIFIGRDMTTRIVPNQIMEHLSDVYGYMDKSVALSDKHSAIKSGHTIINYDFHDKETGESLYCVVKPSPMKSYKMVMVSKLFTAREILQEYDLDQDQLPGSLRPINIRRVIFLHRQSIHNKMNKVISNTHWDRISILSATKFKNKMRVTLELKKFEFKNLVKSYIDEEEPRRDLIPIIMFTQNTESGETDTRMEFVKIVSIDSKMDIGISFYHNQQRKTVIVTGIHLERQAIQQQHELLAPDPNLDSHCSDCKYLSAFGTNNKTNFIRIGSLS